MRVKIVIHYFLNLAEYALNKCLIDIFYLNIDFSEKYTNIKPNARNVWFDFTRLFYVIAIRHLDDRMYSFTSDAQYLFDQEVVLIDTKAQLLSHNHTLR